MFVEDKRVEAA